MKKKIKKSAKKCSSIRTHRHAFLLNNEENKALNFYLARYKIPNKSKFIRETLMTAILRKMEEDHPTLFD
ncbi:MAG TPA: hypothetical protein PK903_02645 [Paludibacteraceae bacterium]|jgi:hypothetical protein|nr:hypothetical protein [Paludibacteraceae bacterium]MDS1031649.1 hypothetical protein [Porphyromonadaceae sp. NP-X]NLJ20775.1 hypothetical protein [Bacteroidales bacterium]MBP9017141.1 hypothetical protein [Paludibacteraceae bacterium]HNZ61996.1 hypothetical protein [Paludibacteraceae bacterium]